MSRSTGGIGGGDNILKTYATGIENILIEMNVPAVKYLSLIEESK